MGYLFKDYLTTIKFEIIQKKGTLNFRKLKLSFSVLNRLHHLGWGRLFQYTELEEMLGYASGVDDNLCYEGRGWQRATEYQNF